MLIMKNSSVILKTLLRAWPKIATRHFSKSVITKPGEDTAVEQCPKKSDEEPKAPVQNQIKPEPLNSSGLFPEVSGLCTVDSCDDWYEEPRIVIIGAGIAGLSAAARLTERGITNFVILEAYERPGGRIQSCWIGDTVAELGAYWRPEEQLDSPVYNLAAREDPPRPGVPASEHPRGLFTRAVGGKMPLAPVVSAYYKFRQIEREANSIYCHGGSKQHGSLVNFISLRIQQELHEYPENQQHDAARIMFGLAHMLNARCGYDTSLICYDHLGCFMHMPGADVHVPLGNVGMLAPLLRDLPEGCIHYCTPARTIYWGTCHNDGQRAIVTCGDGSEYCADYVIVTVSLGNLLANTNRLFCPELPGSKITAMQYLGYNHCNRVYLEYSRPFAFWQTTNLHFKFCNGSRADWSSGVTAIEPMPQSKHVMCAWVVGPEARAMESLSDRDVAEGLTDMLRWATGCPFIPYPSSILRSQWGSDPFFYGAHSFEVCCSNGDAQRALACPLPGPSEPVPPILLFAGEATVAGHYATVSGARLSGIREAERIVSLTCRFMGPPIFNPEQREIRRQKRLASAQSV